MAKSSTTHVIEIETGIGEPAFIPLTLGTETQPISVGKKGMWRIESARVLDIHAFVYFDGTALFMQSADEEASAATVDGYKIGKAWTELRAPCKIEIGAARLRFRSLMPESEDHVTAPIPVASVRAELQATGPNLPPPRPPPPSTQSAPTMAQDHDEPTPITRHQESQPQSQRPKPAPPPPVSSKPERPFRPGAFSVADADESTRFKPLETSGQNPAASTGPQPSRPPAPIHAMPPGPDTSMHSASMPPMMGPVPSGTFQMAGPGVAPGTMTGPMQMPPAYASGGYPAAGPHGQPPMSGFPPPSGYPQPPMAAPPPANPFAAFVATFKQWNPVKKAVMILLPISLVLGIVSLFDNDAPAPQTRGPNGGSSSKLASNELPPWPPGVPCPPPNWPANTPLPCKPNGVPVVPTAMQPNTMTFEASPPPRDGGPVAQGGPGKTSLQRQAVDAITQGDLPRAVALYDELARREPGVTVYAESARILRSKLDAGN